MNKQISLMMLSRVSFILLPLFLITILMSSCEKDFDESPNLNLENHIQVKEYSFKEIIKQPKFNTAFSKVENGIKNKSNKSSDVEENQLNFSIDPATVKEIILNNKTTYTMLVVREQSSPDFFENYVVEIDATNKVSAFLIKYIPDREIKKHEAHNSFSFHGTTEITNINYDSSIFHARERDGECNMSIVCNYGGSEHAAGSNCTQCYSVINCVSSSGGSYTGSTVGNTITTGSGATGGTQGGNLGGNAGSNTSNTTTNTPTTSNPVVTTPVITEAYLSQQAKLKRSKNFYTSLTVDQRTWLNNNLDIKSQIEAYLEKTTGDLDLINYSEEAKAFAIELINLAKDEVNQQDVNALVNISLIVKSGDYLNQSLDTNFLNQIDPFVDLDLSNQELYDPIITQLVIKYHILKSLHSDWDEATLYWETFKDLVHTTLDLVGLAPLFGEIADLVNGVIYTLEGDKLNAGLSYASAVPIAGWAGPLTKYGIKIKNAYNVTNIATNVVTKQTLVWRVINGVVTFGDRNILREMMKKVGVDMIGKQAHHIIPWAKSAHPAIQKAAKSGEAFHMNDLLNGIPLSTAVHSGSHTHYDNLVLGYLNDIPANATPSQAYDAVTNLIDLIRTTIKNNPGIPINQLNF